MLPRLKQRKRRWTERALADQQQVCTVSVASRRPLFDPRHPDQNQAEAIAVEHVTEILQRSRGKTLGFVNHDQLHVG
jgi:hypothetical protein